MPVHNAEIAAMFNQTAELLENQGENQFRVRAYRNAARVIEALPQSVKSLLAAGRDLSDFLESAKTLPPRSPTSSTPGASSCSML